MKVPKAGLSACGWDFAITDRRLIGNMKKLLLSTGGLALVLVVTSCSDEQTSQMLAKVNGEQLGAQLGKLMGGKNSSQGQTIGRSVGAMSKILIGGIIAQNLDRNDQRTATRATQQVLLQPASSYRPPSNAAPASTSNTTQTSTKWAIPAHPTPARWVSDHSDAQGSATLVAVQPTSTGGECRTVHEIAYVGGQELSQDQKYCRDAAGSWEKT